MVVIASPAAAQDRLALAADIVRQPDARLIKERPRREAAERHRRVALVPQEAAVLQRRASGAVLRIIENRVSESDAVYPGLEMRGAQAEFDGQLAGDFP